MLDSPPLAVGLEQRPDQEHRVARGADERREERAEPEEGRVGHRCGLEIAGQADPAGNHVEPGEEDEERDVLLAHGHERLGLAARVEREDGHPQDAGDDQLVTVGLPPARHGQRTDGDGEQQDGERRDRRERQHTALRSAERIGAGDPLVTPPRRTCP